MPARGLKINDALDHVLWRLGCKTRPTPLAEKQAGFQEGEAYCQHSWSWMTIDRNFTLLTSSNALECKMHKLLLILTCVYLRPD